MKFMRIKMIIAIFIVFTISGSSQTLSTTKEDDLIKSNHSNRGTFSYPLTKKVDHVDEYHGIKVADPYRWLEDLDSVDTKAWIEDQNKLTFGFIRSIPEREAIKKRLTQLWNFEKFSLPFKRGDKYFFWKNDGLQNHSVLYTAKTLGADSRVVIDPNILSKDGTISLSNYSISKDMVSPPQDQIGLM
jgi:prolyl oligopeptidase